MNIQAQQCGEERNERAGKMKSRIELKIGLITARKIQIFYRKEESEDLDERLGMSKSTSGMVGIRGRRVL